MADYIRSVILKQIKAAQFFSIFLDRTFDNSRKEQFSFVIRYFNEETTKVQERLISMKEIHQHNTCLNSLKKYVPYIRVV